MTDFNRMDLLLGRGVKISGKVSIKIPTVREMCYDDDFSIYSRVFTITTREMFSSVREVEMFVEKYPTLWSMVFDKEGVAILGQMFQEEVGSDVVTGALSYWTGLDKSGFKVLGNKKIVHAEGGWIIDESTFDKISNIIIEMTQYTPNEDLIVPKPKDGKRLSDAQWALWEKVYKNRLRKSKRDGATLADKILILSVSFDAYLPLDEIMNMTIYHFNRLYDAVSKKDSYVTQLAIFTSPKFESKNGIKHWKELIK